MKKYRIFAGLGGGFGGAHEVDVLDFETKEDAEQCAYECACETYESYEGLHGLRSVADIMRDEELNEEEAEEAYNEERDSWLSYYIQEV